MFNVSGNMDVRYFSSVPIIAHARHGGYLNFDVDYQEPDSL